jgi:hypothetical protein
MTADRPLADAVVHVAGAVLGDPRFAGSRVTLGKLEFLEIELSGTSKGDIHLCFDNGDMTDYLAGTG